MAGPGKRAQRQIDIVRTLKSLTIHSSGIARRTWVSADRLASALDVDVRQLAGPLAHAESDGLVRLRRTDEGRLAVKLERIAGPRMSRLHAPVVLNDALHDCAQADLVRLVASMPGTAPLVEDVAEKMDVGLDRACQLIAEAEAADWLSGWPDGPEGPACCLTPLSAERLGLQISSDFSKWIRIGAHDPTDDDHPQMLLEADVTNENGHSAFDDIADDIGTPPELAIEAEDVEARAAELAEIELPDVIAIADHRPVKRKTRGQWSEAGIMSILESECLDYDPELRIPRPTKLLGSARSWPVMVPGVVPPRPWTPGDGPCPICRGLPLDSRTACLICLCAGVDPLLARIRSPAPAPDRKPPAPLGTVHTQRAALAGGLG
jgi:hypothetical protein